MTVPFFRETDDDPKGFDLAGGPVLIRRIAFRFAKWTRGRIEDDYRKDVLEFEGKPLFAELIILRMLEKEGWTGVWIDNFSRKFRSQWRRRSDPSAELPVPARALFDRIVAENGGRGGCWDIFAWRRHDYLFVESKGPKDRIRPSQPAWLEAALTIENPLHVSSFVWVEWDFAP